MATAAEISVESTCFDCIPAKLEALIWELDQIRINGGGEVMTAQEISVAAALACMDCIPDKWAAALFLGNEVVENGGGGGGGSNNISGAGSPVGVVTPDAINQFYRDTTGTGLWQSNGLTNVDWINWI